MKVYAGAPAAARHYVEADRGRADDYYLAEGTGIARRYAAADGRVEEQAPLSGDAYEAWVASLDPDSGMARGRLRTDDRAVRFVEVVVNGPKSWSLAAALHPEIAEAYDAAQDRAATQVIGWLAEHATTRVGPRGGQVQVPVEALEAVTVRHYTSRTGDPHRHLHLQINARVFAVGKWRGLHTVGVRDSLAAINGIGHAAVVTDPQFRAALAAHGYTVDGTGEIRQLADYVGPFSARAAQIGRNMDRYEREWTQAHAGEHLGPALRRAWDTRAWAEGRPGKVTPAPGEDLTARWQGELAALGYRDRNTPVDLTPTPVGVLDRDAVVGQVLARLGAGRSAWNAADIRGQVEQLIAVDGIVAAVPVRAELAEDLTARALERCVPLLCGDGGPLPVPGHIRAWTSQSVLDVEADLTARLEARAQQIGADAGLGTGPAAGPERLDVGQAAAVAALAGDRPLVVIEGAAGVGKTTTLAATRDVLDEAGRRLMVVTPTLKAAKVAEREVGAAAGSVAWLAFQHGWRWNQHGAWTRLAVGQADPLTGLIYVGPGDGARLRPGDLLVVDEAGMLDQDTARALLTVADECRVRVALLGDRHQLAAVGRGGVLDLAARCVDPAAHLTLDTVHRFTRTDRTGVSVPDAEYADLSLAMRTGDDPGAVFNALAGRGQIRLHADPAALLEALAAIAAGHHREAEQVAVVVDTREQAAELNAAIRRQLVADRRVDDTAVVTTRVGHRIGVGDLIATRRNDRDLGVANRDTWTVTAVGRHGELVVTPVGGVPAGVTPRILGVVTPAAPAERVLSADYVTSYVELAYASTAHGVQGDTVTAAHLVVGEHTGAASAYVGMTRGRTANTAHLVAAGLDDAREQWIAVVGRDRADLGPTHAAELAAREAAGYAAPRPLEEVLAELQQAWSAEQRYLDRLAVQQSMRDGLRELVALPPESTDQLATLTGTCRSAAIVAEQARERAAACGAVVATEAGRIRDTLLTTWDTERDAARAAARVVLDGTGRLGFRRAAVARAGQQLTDWANRWRPHLPNLPRDTRELARAAGWFDDRSALWTAFDVSARRAAEHGHPELAALSSAADAARHPHEQARHALSEGRRRHEERPTRFGALVSISDPAARLADADGDIAATHHELVAVRARIVQLKAEPAILTLPSDRLAQERHAWRGRRDAERNERQPITRRPTAPAPAVSRPQPERLRLSVGRAAPGPHLGR
ncbi:MobF family relaxase [Modestobacter sp. DSM 44400]|uniref:MobF family relaxase n=1 Tax=Modestobacter sp. DSM 44400 TaxID=1550230 RepID=UPI000B8404B2|nr:MobF family relaxase [Modestobacter sp. DSM 44400]